MKLYQGAPSTSDALLYTADRRFTPIIVTCANTTGTAATVTLNLAYAGAAAAAANQIIPACSVPANTVVIFDFPHELNAGDTIRGVQGTSAAITLTIEGVDLGRPIEVHDVHP